MKNINIFMFISFREKYGKYKIMKNVNIFKKRKEILKK